MDLPEHKIWKDHRCNCGLTGCEVDDDTAMLAAERTAELMGISLSGAAFLLHALKDISEGLAPGFKAMSGVLLVIVELVQDMNGVQADFGMLLHEICSITIIVDNHINKTGGEMSKAMSKSVEDLEYRLKHLATYIQTMKTRSRLTRFLRSPRDKTKIVQYRRYFDSALRRFELQMGLDTNFSAYKAAAVGGRRRRRRKKEGWGRGRARVGEEEEGEEVVVVVAGGTISEEEEGTCSSSSARSARMKTTGTTKTPSAAASTKSAKTAKKSKPSSSSSKLPKEEKKKGAAAGVKPAISVKGGEDAPVVVAAGAGAAVAVVAPVKRGVRKGAAAAAVKGTGTGMARKQSVVGAKKKSVIGAKKKSVVGAKKKSVKCSAPKTVKVKVKGGERGKGEGVKVEAKEEGREDKEEGETPDGEKAAIPLDGEEEEEKVEREKDEDMDGGVHPVKPKPKPTRASKAATTPATLSAATTTKPTTTKLKGVAGVKAPAVRGKKRMTSETPVSAPAAVGGGDECESDNKESLEKEEGRGREVSGGGEKGLVKKKVSRSTKTMKEGAAVTSGGVEPRNAATREVAAVVNDDEAEVGAVVGRKTRVGVQSRARTKTG